MFLVAAFCVPLPTAADRPAASSLLGLVVESREFKFSGSGTETRLTEVRATCADRNSIENSTIRRGARGDSLISHTRDIWRLDKGVRWSLDFLDRTYVEVDLQTEREVSQAYLKMVQPPRLETRVDLHERQTIAGWPAERYREQYRDPNVDSVVTKTDAWIATGVPGVGIRRSFDEALDRMLASRGINGRAGADSGSQSLPPGGIAMRVASFMIEPELQRPQFSPTDTSLAARAERALTRTSAPVTTPERHSRLADSLARAWRLSIPGAAWAGEEITSIRETGVPEALFEIPPGFKRRPLSQSRDFWPWELAAKRPPPGVKRDPRAPPRLDPFAALVAQRRTFLHADPSTRWVRDTVQMGQILDPVDLEPENGFYHVKATPMTSPNGWVGDGWVAAKDVKDMGDTTAADVTASLSELIQLVQRINSSYKPRAISSIRVDTSQVIVVVGKDWQLLGREQRKMIGGQLSSAGNFVEGVHVVFRDSVTSRTVATYRHGKFLEH